MGIKKKREKKKKEKKTGGKQEFLPFSGATTLESGISHSPMNRFIIIGLADRDTPESLYRIFFQCCCNPFDTAPNGTTLRSKEQII